MRSDRSTGFIALTALVVMALSTLMFSLGVVESAVLYADSVIRREFRIQARLNASSCLEVVKLMAYKDYFLRGSIRIREFGCTAFVENDFSGNISVHVVADVAGVSARAMSGTMQIW